MYTINNKLRLLFASFLVSALIMLSAQGNGVAIAADNQPDKFSIGAILTLSGPMAAMGLLEKDGIDIAVEEFNKDGGVVVQGKKRPIEVIYFDDEGTVRKAMDGAHELITKHNVKAIVGLRMNEAIEAVQQLTEKKKVLVLTSVASYPGVFLGKKYGILIGDSGWTESTSLARLLTMDPEKLQAIGFDPAIDKRYNFKNKKIAYYGRDEMYCLYAELGIADAIEAFGKEKGLKYVGDSIYPLGTVDVSPYVQRMMASKPDIVYIGLYIYEEFLKLTRALKEMGYNFGPNGDLLLVNANDGFVWPHVVNPLYKEGINLKGSISLGQDMPLEVAKAYPMRQEFLGIMKDKHNRVPGLMEDSGYDQILFMVHAVEKAGTLTDTDAILDALLSLKVDGVRGPGQTFVTPETVPELGIYVNQIVMPSYVCIIGDENQYKYTGHKFTTEHYWGRGVAGKELLIK
jgi:branched-chain amino acid transport system substrate-binding protein